MLFSLNFYSTEDGPASKRSSSLVFVLFFVLLVCVNVSTVMAWMFVMKNDNTPSENNAHCLCIVYDS